MSHLPHKEFNIEEKNQNWIKVEGERLRFPNDDTMFPHGIDAYIDDIDQLINFKDGFIKNIIYFS